MLKLKDGRWRVRASLGTNALGKREFLYRYTSKGATQTEANALRQRTLREAKRLRSAGPERPKLPRLFGPTIDMWLEFVALHREPNSHRTYENYARNHVKPALGRIPRENIDAFAVQRFLDAKLKSGMKPNTVRGLWTVITATLSWAERMGGGPNMATSRLVEVPPIEYAPENILDLDEAHRLLASIRDHWLYALFLTGLVLGQRQSSMLGLTWPDIGLPDDPNEYARIRFLRKLVRVKGAWLLRPVSRSRTKKAPRSLPLPIPVAEALREHRARQARERELLEGDWRVMEFDGREIELVFTTSTGAPLWASSVDAQFHRCLEKAGLDRRRFHDLRHSAASIMIALKIPIEVVSMVLAHAGIQITFDLYGHLRDDYLREQLKILDAAWGEREDAV